MAINVSDLPPKYQAQAMKKYMEQQQRRGASTSRRAAAGSGKRHEIPQHPHRAGDSLRGRPAFRQPERSPQVRRSGCPPGKGGRSAICASRWISPCRKRLPTRRESGCGRSATRRILHTTSRQTGSYTEVMRHTTQNKAGCPGSSSWRT